MRTRVLWLIKGLGPGGAETLLASSAAVRDRTGFDYSAAYLVPAKSALVPKLEAEGVEVTCLRSTRGVDLRWPVRLRRLLRARQPDIVHSHAPLVATVARLVARTLPRALRPVTVSTEHNVWPAYAAPTRLLNALTYPLDRAHFAVSEEARRSMPRRWRRRTETVVHGVVVGEVRRGLTQREPVRTELGVERDQCVAVTIANYRVHKDFETLFVALRLVVDRGVPARLVVVGQGPREAEVRQAHARHELGDAAVLLGYRPDATAVLAGGDLFVLSSQQEGLPVALMEALALGLPVVATAVGGVPEVVEDGVEGLLVPPRRPDLLADAIARVATDPELRARLAKAAATRGAELDIRRAVRHYEMRYRSLVSQNEERAP